VQQSFYNLPRLATGQRWRAEVPAGFEFVLKAPQLITHDPTSPTYRRLRRPLSAPERARYGAFRPTSEVHAVWQATLELARALGSALVLFQCPPSFTPTSEHVRHLTRFFETIDRGGLRLDLTHAVDPFQRASVWGEPAYYRLYGRGGARYRYSDADLADLRVRVEPGPAYVLFNNTAMWDDARRSDTRWPEAMKEMRQAEAKNERVLTAAGRPRSVTPCRASPPAAPPGVGSGLAPVGAGCRRRAAPGGPDRRRRGRTSSWPASGA
jgi:uncharacterized protein YecE (DUF72 family)